MRLIRFAQRVALLGGAAALGLCGLPGHAGAQEIKVTRQYGLPYLPLMVMEHEQLLEKHLKQLGVQ
ncbi:MAG TPA: ABC transporter substrate-binding protein, partial [Casimicrobiaceae bacterium]|nr:ABC transporter substrate-binding protein [Casimicrobiaceae bacterium]